MTINHCDGRVHLLSSLFRLRPDTVTVVQHENVHNMYICWTELCLLNALKPTQSVNLSINEICALCLFEFVCCVPWINQSMWWIMNQFINQSINPSIKSSIKSSINLGMCLCSPSELHWLVSVNLHSVHHASGDNCYV